MADAKHHARKRTGRKLQPGAAYRLVNLWQKHEGNGDRRSQQSDFNVAFAEVLRHPHPVSPEMLQRSSRATLLRRPEHEISLWTRVSLALYRKTGAPLFALAVVEQWPVGFPLPDDVMHYLQRACGSIGRTARDVAEQQKPEKIDLGAILVSAMELKGGHGERPAFERLGRMALAMEIAADYNTRLAAGNKSIAIYDDLAKERGLRTHTLKRLVKEGRMIIADSG